MEKIPLTLKEKKVLDFIRKYIEENELVPSLFEIAESFKIKRSTAGYYLKQLKKRGYIAKVDGAYHRGWKLL